MTAAATASGSVSAIARAAGPATTIPEGSSSAGTQLSDGVDPANNVPVGDRTLGLAKLGQCCSVRQHVKRLLERFEIIRADEHRRRGAVPSDHNTFMVSLHSVDKLRQAILHRPQRFRRHGYHCATARRSYCRVARRPDQREGAIGRLGGRGPTAFNLRSLEMVPKRLADELRDGDTLLLGATRHALPELRIQPYRLDRCRP